MSEITQLVDRYIAIWHEPDANRRRKAIADLWVEDGTHVYPERACQGYQAIEDRVAEAYDEFVNKGGFVFRQVGKVESHHDAVTFHWEMVPSGGGEVAATGTDFILLNSDGRIRSDYQF